MKLSCEPSDTPLRREREVVIALPAVTLTKARARLVAQLVSKLPPEVRSRRTVGFIAITRYHLHIGMRLWLRRLNPEHSQLVVCRPKLLAAITCIRLRTLSQRNGMPHAAGEKLCEPI